MNEVLTAEGFDLDAVTQLAEMGRISPEAAALHDDLRTPTWENLKIVKSQIVGDLTEERGELVQIQFALVEKIAAARLNKLATLPLEAQVNTTIDANAPNLGRVSLERILSDLRAEVRLLPEAANIIRGTSDDLPTTNER